MELREAVQAGARAVRSGVRQRWGYTGSTGDVDYTWDYTRDGAFRSHPAMAGWLYKNITTCPRVERYWRATGPKETGLASCRRDVLRDLHSLLPRARAWLAEAFATAKRTGRYGLRCSPYRGPATARIRRSCRVDVARRTEDVRLYESRLCHRPWMSEALARCGDVRMKQRSQCSPCESRTGPDSFDTELTTCVVAGRRGARREASRGRR